MIVYICAVGLALVIALYLERIISILETGKDSKLLEVLMWALAIVTCCAILGYAGVIRL